MKRIAALAAALIMLFASPVYAFSEEDLKLDSSLISGVKEGGVYKSGRISIDVNMYRSSNEPGSAGFINYIPSRWSVGGKSGTFPKSAPYEASFVLQNEGDYTLCVTFELYAFDNDSWYATGETYDITVDFTVKGKGSGNVEFSDREPSASVKWLALAFVLIMTAALLSGVAALVLKIKEDREKKGGE